MAVLIYKETNLNLYVTLQGLSSRFAITMTAEIVNTDIKV
jgi:hypothetical protein